MRQVKTPPQMRREAEAREKPRRSLPEPAPLDPARRPQLDRATYAAGLRTGAIELG